MADWNVRAARPEDCAVMCAIYNHYVVNDTCTYATEIETVEERKRWLEAHGERHPVLVAESGGRVVGWASLSPYNLRGAYRDTVEDSVYLDPVWRGQGLGRRLLSELIERARALGHRTIVAAISAEQTGSIALHERQGFVRTGHLREVGYKADQWLDVIYLQLWMNR